MLLKQYLTDETRPNNFKKFQPSVEGAVGGWTAAIRELSPWMRPVCM